jgi:hypothetical protein
MRKYPIDSPQARARIIAAALLADGGLDKSELDLLDFGAVVERLGIPRDLFDETMHAFCDDLNQYGVRKAGGDLGLNPETVAAMLEEIRHPDIRRRLLCVILEIVSADRRLDDSEAGFVSQAFDAWEADAPGGAAEPRRAGRRWPPRVRRLPAELRN